MGYGTDYHLEAELEINYITATNPPKERIAIYYIFCIVFGCLAWLFRPSEANSVSDSLGSRGLSLIELPKRSGRVKRVNEEPRSIPIADQNQMIHQLDVDFRVDLHESLHSYTAREANFRGDDHWTTNRTFGILSNEINIFCLEGYLIRTGIYSDLHLRNVVSVFSLGHIRFARRFNEKSHFNSLSAQLQGLPTLYFICSFFARNYTKHKISYVYFFYHFSYDIHQQGNIIDEMNGSIE